MKPHPRIRKTIKCGGTAVSTLFIAILVSSVWFSLSWTAPHGNHIEMQTGRMRLEFPHYDRTKDDHRLYFRWRSYPFSLRTISYCASWGSWQSDNWWTKVNLPLWLPTSIALACTAIAWRLDAVASRRKRLGLCIKCHYDRAGLDKSAVCPECGSPPA